MLKTSGNNVPLIGITSVCTSRNLKLDNAYVEAVFRAGGIAVILPQADSESRAVELVESVDGIVFSGGEDLAPELYGEARISRTGRTNTRRDCSDLTLIRAALGSGKAILGICRGAQAVNVALGGSLHQDIGDSHRSRMHRITIEEGSALRGILGCGGIVCNSLHHQAIKRLADGLCVSARSDDGVIEAYEGLPGLNLIGTQFHPEKLAVKNDERFLRIFRNLIERAA